MSQTSVIYRSGSAYELVMRLLYGRHYRDRMRAVADQVPAGASVIELCCGPGTLYKRYLRTHVSSYTGLDVNPGFVRALQAQGIDARLVDLRASQPLPTGEVVLMQASLYHFLPAAEPIVEQMLAAASRLVVVSEPIRNLSSSDHAVIGRLGRKASDPGDGGGEGRFTETTLDRLMERFANRLEHSFLIPGGREKVYVLRAGA